MNIFVVDSWSGWESNRKVRRLNLRKSLVSTHTHTHTHKHTREYVGCWTDVEEVCVGEIPLLELEVDREGGGWFEFAANNGEKTHGSLGNGG